MAVLEKPNVEQILLEKEKEREKERKREKKKARIFRRIVRNKFKSTEGEVILTSQSVVASIDHW